MERSVAPAPEPPGTWRPAADGVPNTRHDVFWRGLAVLAGWYATALVAIALWIPTLSNATPEGECASFGCAQTPRESAILGLILLGATAGPVGVAGALATLGLASAKPIRSGVVAGSLAAAVGVIGVPALAAVVLL